MSRWLRFDKWFKGTVVPAPGGRIEYALTPDAAVSGSDDFDQADYIWVPTGDELADDGYWEKAR